METLPGPCLDKAGTVRIGGAAVAVTVSEAREILGRDCLTFEEVAAALGTSPGKLPGDLGRAAAMVPFSAADLMAAHRDGGILVFRLPRDTEGPLTIERLIQRFPKCFDPKILEKVGYALRDEWGILLEPLAKTDTCALGWHLSRKAPLEATCNLPYHDQDAVLATSGRGGERRRTAVEAAMDLVLYHACRGEKLLAEAYDWTSSKTIDAGYLNVGGFGESGMTLVGFSAAVRHASLGICPTRGAV